ncbi:hypothetical protein MIR68_006806 [Amoeboaphelidium protococcarum]|nr:hypothetical protein MIR68_006806 [Amoeboaphelidium protococcarum]
MKLLIKDLEVGFLTEPLEAEVQRVILNHQRNVVLKLVDESGDEIMCTCWDNYAESAGNLQVGCTISIVNFKVKLDNHGQIEIVLNGDRKPSTMGKKLAVISGSVETRQTRPPPPTPPVLDQSANFTLIKDLQTGTYIQNVFEVLNVKLGNVANLTLTDYSKDVRGGNDELEPFTTIICGCFDNYAQMADTSIQNGSILLIKDAFVKNDHRGELELVLRSDSHGRKVTILPPDSPLATALLARRKKLRKLDLPLLACNDQPLSTAQSELAADSQEERPIDYLTDLTLLKQCRQLPVRCRIKLRVTGWEPQDIQQMSQSICTKCYVVFYNTNQAMRACQCSKKSFSIQFMFHLFGMDEQNNQMPILICNEDVNSLLNAQINAEAVYMNSSFKDANDLSRKLNRLLNQQCVFTVLIIPHQNFLIAKYQSHKKVA